MYICMYIWKLTKRSPQNAVNSWQSSQSQSYKWQPVTLTQPTDLDTTPSRRHHTTPTSYNYSQNWNLFLEQTETTFPKQMGHNSFQYFYVSSCYNHFSESIINMRETPYELKKYRNSFQQERGVSQHLPPRSQDCLSFKTCTENLANKF